MDAFERIAQDETVTAGLPPTAKRCLELMREIVRISDSPADVAVACNMGMAYVLAASEEPAITMETFVKTSYALVDIMAVAQEIVETKDGEPKSG